MDKKKIKIAILAFSSVIMAAMTASAILADISLHFAGLDQSVIQMVLTIPSMMGMVFAMISGPLSLKIAKKSMVVFGLVCAFIGGMAALTIGGKSIYILLFCSLLIGVSQGINSTMSMALIADYFEGDEASSLMGLQSAFVNGGSMVILLISGMLAGVKWNYSYIVYLVFLPIIFIVQRNLPKDQPSSHLQGGEGQRGRLNGTVYFVVFAIVVYGIFSYVFQTNIAIYLSNSGLGDASTSGLVNSMMVATGAVTGVIYGRIKKILKKFTFSAALFSAAGSLLVLYSVRSLPGAFISAALAGFGLSLLMPTATFIVSTAVGPSMSATAIAMVNAGNNVGMFFSPFLINPIASAIGGGEYSKFIIAAIGLLTIAVISVLCNRAYIKSEINNPSHVTDLK